LKGPVDPQPLWRTKGKAERFIETLLADWFGVTAHQTSEERNR
jgi:hypothetical protein